MPRASISESLRNKVRMRAKGRCEYCLTSDVAQVATFACDHCVPESRGGPTVLGNLAWACPRCNGSKLAAVEAIDPDTGENADLFNPRTDRWAAHFRWSKDWLTIEPLTPVGRATEQRLKMNREKMITIRRLMMKLDLHPPL